MVPIDYRKFLGKTERQTLPYLGGSNVHAPDRRLRVTRREAAGWWVFEIEGRKATPIDRLEAPNDALQDLLDRRPRVQGHAVGPWLFTSGDAARRLYLTPAEEDPIFSPTTARRWFDDTHIYAQLEFEDEPESAVREAYLARADDLRELAVPGITPSLKAAFGWAVAARRAREREVSVQPIELLDRLHEIASGQVPVDLFIDRIEARRHEARPDEHWIRAQARAAERRLAGASSDNAEERAARVLADAGADLLGIRLRGDHTMDVIFRYLDYKFTAIVDIVTLHVYDSGICLSGADEELGLDALPVVIREAHDTHQLNIMR